MKIIKKPLYALVYFWSVLLSTYSYADESISLPEQANSVAGLVLECIAGQYDFQKIDDFITNIIKGNIPDLTPDSLAAKVGLGTLNNVNGLPPETAVQLAADITHAKEGTVIDMRTVQEDVCTAPGSVSPLLDTAATSEAVTSVAMPTSVSGGIAGEGAALAEVQTSYIVIAATVGTTLVLRTVALSSNDTKSISSN